jgi:hypothetical protein
MKWIKDPEGKVVSDYPSTAAALNAKSVYHFVIKKLAPACRELKTGKNSQWSIQSH